MKFALAVALVVLVISQGTESASLEKHDIPAEIEKITKYFQDLSRMLTITSTELIETLKAHDLTGKTEAQVQPLLEKVKEQLKPLATNFEEQFKPLSQSILAQLKPLAQSVETQLEDLLETVMAQTKALLPPQ
ncbi:type-4 ice-structuring protein-like [Clupea harengus]|uniref:Type-4 ice-structuring protein-like n=1 Tax=Clupea harengus TaxID=7950 RepID=A0A6P8FYS2_CLUHA|nr:type-4 ice-structuring protein-like [Clupea harengus]XP_042565175.1 type-4 ice-structuring protein-like [Clupea harengus]